MDKKLVKLDSEIADLEDLKFLLIYLGYMDLNYFLTDKFIS